MNFDWIKIIFRMLALVSMASGILLTIRLRPPFGFLVWIFKVLSALFSPVVALGGMIGMLYGFLRKDIFSLFSGSTGLLLSARHIRLVSRTYPDFDTVFGSGWERQIPPQVRNKMLSQPWSWLHTSQLNRRSTSQVEKDVVFADIPGTDRELVCDVWQPPPDSPRTRTAVIYFHSSAWCLVDKDFGTRPLFAYLSAQGYVVMDVAYRLCRETDIAGMTGDVFRAIAWMKAHASRYEIDAQQIILVGASAGGQIALLAAYARNGSDLIPTEIKDQDLSVRGVVSYYGPPDMHVVRAHNAVLTSTAIRVLKLIGLGRPLAWISARILGLVTGRYHRPLATDLYEFLQTENIIDKIMGGAPGEVPEQYEQVSPAAHIHSRCPPTLLIHGEHDSLVPAASTRNFYRRLRNARVRASYLELPQTDHGFDLILSPFSPSMQASIFALERFLALLS
jgi:acetyl esterase/lipase